MLGSIIDALARADLVFVTLAFVAYTIGVVVVAWRWRIVLRGVTGRAAPISTLVLGTLAAAFVNNVTPAGRLGGEACRVAVIVRRGLASVSAAAIAAGWERLSELPAVLSIAAVALAVLGRMRWPGRSGISPGWWLGLAALIVAIVLGSRHLARLARRLRVQWRALESTAVAPSALALAVVLSTVIWILDVVRLRLVVAAFHAPVGLPQAAMLSAVTIVAGLVPNIGGLGIIEGGLIAALVGLRVAPADAVAITAVERSLSYGVSTVAGLASLSLVGGRDLWAAVRTATKRPSA